MKRYFELNSLEKYKFEVKGGCIKNILQRGISNYFFISNYVWPITAATIRLISRSHSPQMVHIFFSPKRVLEKANWVRIILRITDFSTQSDIYKIKRLNKSKFPLKLCSSSCRIIERNSFNSCLYFTLQRSW